MKPSKDTTSVLLLVLTVGGMCTAALGQVTHGTSVLGQFPTEKRPAGIPALEDLVVAPGGAGGDLLMDWHAPLVHFLNGEEADDAAYEFRFSATELTDATWDQGLGLPVMGSFPDVGVSSVVGVDLNLVVMSANSNSYPAYFVSWDQATCKANLSITSQGAATFGKPLRNRLIYFEVYDSSDTLVDQGQDYTNELGTAEWTSKDLTDNAAGETFHFFAKWNGQELGLFGGATLMAPGLEDDEYYLLYDSSTAHTWPQDSGGGGELTVDVAGLPYGFMIPGGANDPNTELVIQSPLGPVPPPPPGMLHLASIRFNLVHGGAFVEALKPITISLDYTSLVPASNWSLAESSLRGYLWDGLSWIPQDLVPLQLSRDEHRVAMGTVGANFDGIYSFMAEEDWDYDGLGFSEELNRGTLDNSWDSDLDGVSDGDEVWFTLADPLDDRKLEGPDQWSFGNAPGMVSGSAYFLAGRIVSNSRRSPVSNNFAFVAP